MQKFLIRISSALLVLALCSTGLSSVAAHMEVIDDHPHAQALEFMVERGVLSLSADGRVSPEGIMQRADFIQMVIGLAFPSEDIDKCLAEHSARALHIDRSLSSAKYLCMAALHEISEAERPTDAILAAEAAKIALDSFSVAVEKAEPWFASYLAMLDGMGALPESVDSAHKSLNRGESAYMVYRLVAGLERVGLPENRELRGSAEDIRPEATKVLRLARQLLIFLNLVNPAEMKLVIDRIRENHSTRDLSLASQTIDPGDLRSSVKVEGESTGACEARCVAERELHCKQRIDGSLTDCRRLGAAEKQDLCELSCQ